jgi:hypothetical protein
MHLIHTMRSLLLGTAAAAAFITAASGQSILGPPSEANHFIETPAGWEHPMTAWGEPDIQATLNMMQAAGVPLERCASALPLRRAALRHEQGVADRGGVQQRLEAVANRVDLGRELIAKGTSARAPLRRHRSRTPQRQTNLIVESAERPAARAHRRGQAPRAAMGSGWRCPAKTHLRGSARFRLLGQLPLARHAVVDDAVPLQRRLPHLGRRRVIVVFDLEMIHDARVIYTDNRAGAASGHQAVHGRVARPLGGQHAGRRDDQLQGRSADDQPGGGRLTSGNRFPVSDRMKTTERITRAQRRDVAL